MTNNMERNYVVVFTASMWNDIARYLAYSMEQRQPEDLCELTIAAVNSLALTIGVGSASGKDAYAIAMPNAGWLHLYHELWEPLMEAEYDETIVALGTAFTDQMAAQERLFETVGLN